MDEHALAQLNSNNSNNSNNSSNDINAISNSNNDNNSNNNNININHINVTNGARLYTHIRIHYIYIICIEPTNLHVLVYMQLPPQALERTRELACHCCY